MPSVVIDASAIGAVAFNEPEGAALVERLRDARRIAPTLLRCERASLCAKTIKRLFGSSDVMHAHLRDALDAVSELREVDAEAVVTMALRHGLTTYDAACLWLSLDLGLEPVALDARLARAPRSH